MDVELPTTGCNIISSATTFYNYSADGRTRETYVIYDGVAHLQSTSTSSVGYNYTGTCLNTGDLVYRPEVNVYFPVISFCICCCILLFIYHLIIKRLLP